MAIGGEVITVSNARSASIEAVITRADGTIQNLGVVSYWHRNPLICWAVNYWIRMKERNR